LIAQALGDVHEQQVWRILQAHKIDDTSITDQFRGAAGYVDCIFGRRETGQPAGADADEIPDHARSIGSAAETLWSDYKR
jgi:hypothetical protein